MHEPVHVGASREASPRAIDGEGATRNEAPPSNAAVVEGCMALTCDFLVIGSGIAGLTFALEAAAHGDVIVVTKRAREESSTKYAQGGIAAVLDESDSFEAHVKDTLDAGGGLSHVRAVELTVKDAPARIAMLRKVGTKFDLAPARAHADESGPSLSGAEQDLDLHLEGGHSARRIVHTGDMTGREVERALVEAVAANSNIRVLEEHMAIDLITAAKYGGPEVCAGAYVLDVERGKVVTILSRATVLATGGAGKVYLYTTNPDVATGDGIAMAFRAGAEVANMEFYQFHPTCLFHPQSKNFLITEALRGEGAILRRLDGSPFMKEFDPRAELAPRDIVARAIDHEMKRSGAEHVLLDITHKDTAFIQDHFPGIYAQCMRYASGRSASVRTRGFMARTVSRRTRCSKEWSSRIARRTRSRRSTGRSLGRRCRIGTSARRCRATRRSSSPRTGRSSAG
jgi:L-aspartate oxidase